MFIALPPPGTTIIDGIPATFYNIVFTSLPVLFFSLLDRPVKYFTTLMRYPQVGDCLSC